MYQGKTGRKFPEGKRLKSKKEIVYYNCSCPHHLEVFGDQKPFAPETIYTTPFFTRKNLFTLDFQIL